MLVVSGGKLFEQLVGRIPSALRRRNRHVHGIRFLSNIEIQEGAAVLLTGDHPPNTLDSLRSVT